MATEATSEATPTAAQQQPASPSVVTLPRQVVLKEGVEDRAELCSHMRSHQVVVARGCRKAHVIVEQNQRLAGMFLVGCSGCRLSLLDSAVLTSRVVRLVNCESCEVVVEDCDVRRVELFRCVGCKVVLIGDDALIENAAVVSREGCRGNRVVVAALRRTAWTRLGGVRFEPLRDVAIPDTADTRRHYATRVARPPDVSSVVIVDDAGEQTAEGAALLRELRRFTAATTLPAADPALLEDPAPAADAVLEALTTLERTPYEVTDEQVAQQYDEERREWEEPDDALQAKVQRVAELLRAARHCVVYTGAGISTAADIPDFRGPRGAWTMRDKGKAAAYGVDMGEARPTLAHYAITELARRGLVKFVVTTNMDALHARTGLPPHLLEELHGSCNTLHCTRCGRNVRFAEEVERGAPDHATDERCDWCGGPMVDTIVNFSDVYRNELEPVIVGWHSHECDLALVLGTSMCVQPAACYTEKTLSHAGPDGTVDGHLVICNLQATPSDHLATVRAFSTTDRFMSMLMDALEIREFDRSFDAKNDWAEDEHIRAQRAKKAVPEKDASAAESSSSRGFFFRIFGPRR